MKLGFSIICLCISLSMVSARLTGDSSDPTRDNIILQDCEGHMMDDANYIRDIEGSCTTPGGLMGVWGCRKEPREHSVCLPSVQGDVIGVTGDTCGCCNGICPSLCKCKCDGGVLVKEPFLFLKIKRCYEEGLAEAMVLEDNGVECYDSC